MELILLSLAVRTQQRVLAFLWQFVAEPYSLFPIPVFKATFGVTFFQHTAKCYMF